MTDLTTLLSFFLKDLYAGTLGTTAPVTGILVGSGSASAPSYSFSGDPDTGIANTAANQLDFCSGGTAFARVGTGQLFVADKIGMGATVAAPDVVLQRISSGVLQAWNGSTGFTRLILGTNDATVNGIAIANSGGTMDFVKGDASLNIPARMSTLTTTGKIASYNGVTTAGWGVGAIQAQATAGPVTNGGTASIATYSVGAADGIFQVSADVSVTTSSNHTFSIDCVYTDAASGSRTMLMPMEQLLTGNFISGALITNTLGVGAYASAVMQIRAKASTTITLRTSAGGTFTGVVYTTSGSIVQVG